MFIPRIARHTFFSILISCLSAWGQQAQGAPNVAPTLEFPVTLQQKVVAGKTPVGTKVQAKLVVATLVSGVVFPRNALFSGEVIESVAKSADAPSRLGIRMDSIQWKNQSAPMKAYLTAWYYPIRGLMQNAPYDSSSPGEDAPVWAKTGGPPDPRSPASQPFPGGDMGDPRPLPPLETASSLSDHRVVMKGVESARRQDGSLAISSSKSNLKLDKMTTYVLATGDLLSQN